MLGRRFYRRLGLFFCLALMPLGSRAQTLSTLFTNGPASNRVNIVLLSEGYTAGQLGQFLIDASMVASNLISVPPYSEYNGYFNAYAISVTSPKSGSNHTTTGNTNDTYFHSTYNSFGLAQLLTIPPNDHDANPADGQNKVLNLLSNYFPRHQIVILVVNDTTPGGSGLTPGTTNPLVITSLDPSLAGQDTVAHESGHAFGGLADEYASGAPSGYVYQEWPNVTAQTNRALIKWNAWILPTTPIPTSPFDQDDVGLFEGAQYQATGWYRPMATCKMNDPTYDFCPVCSEQLVKRIYSVVDPIDSFLPAATNLSIGSGQALSFSVTPLQPATHDLAVQWLTNGVVVDGETNIGFQLFSTNLGVGSNRVAAVVYDPTALVRNDSTNVLFTTNVWNLIVDSLSLNSPQYLAGKKFRFTVSGTAPKGVLIQGSGDMVNWTSLLTNNPFGGHLDYTNTGALTWDFYRAIALP